ncbi:transcriptional regulator [Candidatus Vecturithrix granuli]|uniref:Transcriptional regulator n=1 Tax=Vecturithrix granuli TaxID=1499967 RepID=A0A081C8Y9_VECG1|nr:transcriptional regulator [Candidatus Vecturithrix granuli]
MSVRKKNVTLRDVARYAGVSIKTVSNVINDWPYMTDETRAKVREAIKIVGYRPNQMARSLVTGQTKSVGVIIPDIINPFFSLTLRGCEDLFYKNGYSLFLCNSLEIEEREKYYLDVLASRAVDAVILWSTQIARDELRTMIGERLPVVTVGFDGDPLNDSHTIVNLDDIGGSERATQHLIAQGYRQIAHLTTFAHNVVGSKRLKGYRQALESADRQYDPQLVKKNRASIYGGYHATLDLLEHYPVDAIFCHNDLMAVGAIFAAHHLGRRVPEDIGIVGFDDIAMASMVTPPLTTMRITQYEMGKLTGELILERLRQEVTAPKTVLYPVELQIRTSSGGTESTEEQKQQWVEDLVSHLSIESSPEKNSSQ